jgi:hypothetical protein
MSSDRAAGGAVAVVAFGAHLALNAVGLERGSDDADAMPVQLLEEHGIGERWQSYLIWMRWGRM